MKNRIFLLLISMALMWSCNDENIGLKDTSDVEESGVNKNTETATNKICLTKDIFIADSINGRVSARKTYWAIGETIKIKFLNGTSAQQNTVKTHASEWTRYANLHFQWVNASEDADIKIKIESSNQVSGWSTFGNTARIVRQNEASMLLSSLDKGTILHEFGHALGLIHEHQNPSANISWNKEAVYEYFAKVGWNRALVDSQIFSQYTSSSVDYGYFDQHSIMVYEILYSWTTNGVSYPRNTELSIFDRTSIGMIYPFSKTGSNRPSLYMYWNPYYGDHLCTNNWRELGNGGYGYSFDRTLGYLDATPNWDNIQLHRYYSPWTGDHFYTTNFSEMGNARYGYYYEGSMGYVKRTQVAGSLPLYRYWNVRLGDHFYTTNWNELGQGKNGWVFEKIEGYILQ